MHVTVLLAVHNGAATIERAIASVVAQTYGDWDLLVVDDGSTDASADIVQRAASRDPRIAILRNDRRRGLAYSLNRGWRAARGELIARLDADDTCLPDRLARQVSFMVAHPEIAVLGAGAELVDENGNSRGVHLRPEYHERLVAAIYRENPFIHPSVTARRAFFEALGGYDERCMRGQDYELWTRAYRRFRFHNLPRPLIRYTQREGMHWRSIKSGTMLIFRFGWREGRPARGAYYAMRFFAVGCLKSARSALTRMARSARRTIARSETRNA